MSDELPEDDPGVSLVEKALEDLGEHFDSCHIICTRKEHDSKGGYTDTISRRNGNASAAFGSLKETVIKLEEQMRWQMRRSLEKDEE